MKLLLLLTWLCGGELRVTLEPPTDAPDFVMSCGAANESGLRFFASQGRAGGLHDGSYANWWSGKIGAAFGVAYPRPGRYATRELSLAPGCWKSAAAWARHGRPRRVRVSAAGRSIGVALLRNEQCVQRILLPHNVWLSWGQRLTLTVLSTYAGTRSAEACVSEFTVWNGQH